MALPQVQSYRAQIAQAPSAATPSVSFGQNVRADLAVQGQAQYQDTLSKVLDRISSNIFGVAEKMSEREGLQFAVDNPLTQEQLDAMYKGDMSGIDLGNPLNVFNSAVRKARAIEVSAHFEIEDRRKLLDIADQADRGALSAEDARGKISALINASAEVQSNIDPEASYKYRASMATYGSQILDNIAKKELTKNRVANQIKVEQDYTSVLGIIAKSLETPQGINPATNRAWTANEIIDAQTRNFLANARPLIGVDEANKYASRFMQDITNMKVAAINKELMNDKYFANTTETFRRIANGDIDNVRDIASELALTNPQAMEKVMSTFRTAVSDRRSAATDAETQRKRQAEVDANALLIEYYDPQTLGRRKQQIGLQLAQLRVLSIDQMEKFLDPSVKDGDPYAFADLKTQIVNGDISTPEQLKAAAQRAGMNGKQYSQLNDTFLQGYNEERRDAQRYRRRVSGVPDVANVFASKDERHLIEKDIRIESITESLAADFRAKNPGVLVPWMDITRQAVQEYERVDASNAKKTRARQSLADYVEDLRKIEKRTLPDGFVINAESNVEDLVKRKIIPEKDASFVQRQIDELRRVSE